MASIGISDVVYIATLIIQQVKSQQQNNSLCEEIGRRCFTIVHILESIGTTTKRFESAAELIALNSCHLALSNARIFVERFNSSGFVSKFLQARGFQTEFIELNEALSKAADDLQFAMTGQVREQVVAIHDISQALLSRFEHEHVEIIARFDKLDELINIGQEQQDALFGMFHGYSKELQQLRMVVESLKVQKEQNPMAYKREAEKKFRNALHLQCGPPISHEKLTTYFDQLLGEGSFGKVYGGTLQAFGDVAVKTLPIIDGNEIDFLREVAAIERVSVHPNIISFYGWCYIQNPFTGGRLAALITERCIRSLYAVVKDHTYYPSLTTWISYLHQIACAMTFLLRKGMLHRDLKPENVLITKSNTAVISDFGLAITKTTILASTVSTVSDGMIQRKVGGTVGYMAPELTASEASDVYSFGIIASFVLLRDTPWMDSYGKPLHPNKILSECKIRSPKMPSEEDFPELKPSHVALLTDCCAVEPSIRPHFCEVEVALSDCFRNNPKELLISQPSDILLTLIDDERNTNNERVVTNIAPAKDEVITHQQNISKLTTMISNEKIIRTGKKIILSTEEALSDSSDEEIEERRKTSYDTKGVRYQQSKRNSKPMYEETDYEKIKNVAASKVKSAEKLLPPAVMNTRRDEEKKGSGKGPINDTKKKLPIASAISVNSSIPSTTASPSPVIFYDFTKIERLTYGALKDCVMNAPPSKELVRCYIERSRAAKHLLSPFYILCADLQDGNGRQLVYCRKVFMSRTPQYLFCLTEEDLYRPPEQRSARYLGQLIVTTTSKAEFILYDDGTTTAPDDIETVNRLITEDEETTAKKMTASSSSDEISTYVAAKNSRGIYKRELAIIRYNTMKDSLRKMEICIPNGYAKTPSIRHLSKAFEQICMKGKQNELLCKHCTIFHQKTSRHDSVSSCLMDFKQRQTIPSSKNCQVVYSDAMSSHPMVRSIDSIRAKIIEYDYTQDVILQMGKSTTDCYNMDFQAPLSFLQAFAICITRFEAESGWD